MTLKLKLLPRTVLKTKLLPRSTLRGKVEARFPANVIGVSPIVVSPSGGNYTIGFDMSALLPLIPPSGAPISAEYLVGAAHPTLTAERVVTNTATITWDLSTPGQAKANAAFGSGDVVGPAGATDNAIARYDGVTGKLIQNSLVTLGDTGIVGAARVLPTGASTARTLEARFADVINVKDFGAVGDGSVDDTAAIAAAIAATPFGGGLYFPSSPNSDFGGGYRVLGTGAAVFTITKPIRMFGDGPGSMIVFDATMPNGRDGFQFVPPSTIYNVTICDLRIAPNGHGRHALNFICTGAVNIFELNINRVRIAATGAGYSIRAGNIAYSTISECLLDSIWCENSGDGITIRNNSIGSDLNNGIQASFLAGAGGFVVAENVIAGSKGFIVVENGYPLIINNELEAGSPHTGNGFLVDINTSLQPMFGPILSGNGYSVLPGSGNPIAVRIRGGCQSARIDDMRYFNVTGPHIQIDGGALDTRIRRDALFMTANVPVEPLLGSSILDNGLRTGDVVGSTWTRYSNLGTSTPPAPAANNILFYAKPVGGLSHFFALNAGGIEYDLMLGRERLTPPPGPPGTPARTYYVDATAGAGNDNNPGTSAAPFATINGALAVVLGNIDFGGQNVVIQLKDSATPYAPALMQAGWTGGGTLTIIGNANHTSVVINAPVDGFLILGAVLPGALIIKNMKIIAVGGDCIRMQGLGAVSADNIEFAPQGPNQYCLSCVAAGATAQMTKDCFLNTPGPIGGLAFAQTFGTILVRAVNLQFLQPCVFSLAGFVKSLSGSLIDAGGLTFTGPASSITAGKRWDAATGGMILTGGTNSGLGTAENFFPGNTMGQPARAPPIASDGSLFD